MTHAIRTRGRLVALATVALTGGTIFSTCQSSIRTATVDTIQGAVVQAIEPAVTSWLADLGYDPDASTDAAGESGDTP